MNFKIYLTIILILFLFGCGEPKEFNGQKFEESGCSLFQDPKDTEDTETGLDYIPTIPTGSGDDDFVPTIPAPTDIPPISPGPIIFTIPTYTYASEYQEIEEGSGIFFRITCKYANLTYAEKPADVVFYVVVKNATSDKYIYSAALFGIPENTEDSSKLFDYAWGLGPDQSDWVLRYRHSSLDTPKKQCEENFTGVVGFGYTDKYGQTFSSETTLKEFDSNSSKLDY